MESRRVLKEIYVGIGIHVFAFLILGIFLMRPFWLFAISLLVGGVAAALLVYHIYDCLDQALDMEQKSARQFTSLRSLLRLVVRAALMIIAIQIHWVCFVGVTVGLLSPKVSSYLNPKVKKFLGIIERSDESNKINKNRRK